MHKKIPHFKYSSKSQENKFVGCIEMGAEVIHKIADLDLFYTQFGYTVEMAKNGILPEEYIWDTYFRYEDRNCANCYQLNLIEFLLKNSVEFFRKYSDQCDVWIAEHTKNRKACDIAECADRKKY